MVCIDKRKVYIALLLLVIIAIPTIYLSSLFLKGQDGGGGIVFSTIPLSRGNSEWEAIANAEPVKNVETDCYGHEITGTHHVLYCDRASAENYDFKAYFKTANTENFRITEITKETKSQTYEVQTGESRRVTCLKETKNNTCFEPVMETKTREWTETSEQILPISKNGKFDYKVNSKISGEKTYRIEWDDITPTSTREVMQGDINKGTLEFPSVSYYENELKINPVQTYNATASNWAGDFWNTTLSGGAIILNSTSSGGSLDSDPNLRLWLPMNDSGIGDAGTDLLDSTHRTNFNQTGAEWTYNVDGLFGKAIQNGGGTGFFYNETTTSDIISGKQNYTLSIWFRKAGQPMGILSAGVDAGDKNQFAIYVNGGGNLMVFEGLVGENICTYTGVGTDWHNLIVKHNSTGGYCYLDNTLFGNWSGASTPVLDPAGYDLAGFQVGKMVAYPISFNGIFDDLKYYNRSLSDAEINNIWNNQTSPITIYSSSGNFTSSGFCPHLPNTYDWGLFNYTQTDNSTSTNAFVEYRTSNDNTTWDSWKPAPQNTDLENVSSCIQYRINITTTDTSQSAKVSSLSIQYLSLRAPDLNITHPINTTYYNNLTLGINVSATDPDGISRVWYSLDYADNVTIPYPDNVTSATLSRGSHIIQVWANGSDGLENMTEVSFTSINAPPPPIPISPANNTFHSSIPTLITNNSVSSIPLLYYFEISDIPNFSYLNASSSGITEGIDTTSWIPAGLSNGNYSWRVKADDLALNSSWSNTSYFIYDLIIPVIHAIGNASNLVTMDLPVSSAWNFTASDEHLGTCFYHTSDNQANTSVTCNSATYIDTAWATEGAKILTYCTNDSAGNTRCNQTSLMVDYYTYTQSASPSSPSEGSQVKFNLTISKTNIESQFEDTLAVLLFNYTQFPASKTSFNNLTQFIANINVPDGWGSTAGTTLDWNWSYGIYNSSVTLINTTTTTSTITIYDAGLDNCAVYNNTLLTFRLYDEETKASADNNITIETTATLMNPYNSAYYFNYSTNVTSSPLRICASNNFLTFTTFNLSTITKYEYANHVVEYYYIDNYPQAGYTSQNISLYDLKTADSTTFLMSYRDKYYLPLTDAVIDAWKFYVGENVFRSVEHGKTNENGETRLHLVTEDVRYIFKIRKGGQIIYTSPEYYALCLTSPCQINLKEEIATIEDMAKYYNFENVENLQYSFHKNISSRNIRVDFATKDGSIAEMKMAITQSNQYYNNTIYEQTLSSSGGSLSYTIPASDMNTTYDVWIWKDGVFVAYDQFSISPTAYELFGNTGMILAVFIIMTLPLMAITSGVAMIIFALVGVILAGMLTLLTGGSLFGVGSVVIWLICTGIILIIKMNNRRNN